MIEQECKCPKCERYLGRVTLIDGTLVILRLKCRTCRKLVDVVVKREEDTATAA